MKAALTNTILVITASTTGRKTPIESRTLSNGVAPAANTITSVYAPATNNISGEYTAGIATAFFTKVPVYETNKDGDWTDETIWTNNILEGDPYPCPPGGPNGFIVKFSTLTK
jgi:hypothetical protein